METASSATSVLGADVDSCTVAIFNWLVQVGDNVGLVLLDDNYHLKWMNEVKRRQFEKWRVTARSNISDVKCFQVWNEFDEPCSWCPVTHSIRDNKLHLCRSASPDPDTRAALKYSDIVSLPLTRPDSPDRRILEIIFFDQGHGRLQFQRLLDLIQLGDKLKPLLPSIPNAEIFVDLVLLGLLTVVTEHVTDCFAYNCDGPPAGPISPSVSGVRHLTRERVRSFGTTDLEAMSANPNGLQRAWAKFVAKEEPLALKLSDTLKPDEYTALSPVDWLPTRLDPNTMAISVPTPTRPAHPQRYWLILARNKEENSLLLRTDLTNTTLFLSSLRRHVEILATQREQRFLESSLRDRLAVLEHPDLVDAVPFALGKKHELGHLTTMQQAEIRAIRDLNLPSDTKQKLLPHIDRLQGITHSLTRLKTTLGSLKDLQNHYLKAVNVKQLLDRTLAYTIDFAQQPKVTVTRQYISSPDINVMADEALLEQVCFNLIDNAIKALAYTSYRTPTLTISVARSDPSYVDVVFEDNGEGIAPDDQPKVFTRYFTRFPKGIGLGLYYCRKIIADIHKGTLTFTSTWGTRTTFTIHIPSADQHTK